MPNQDPPKYYYTTVQVTGSNQVRAASKAPDYGKVAHWVVGALNWAVNQKKISDAIERIQADIDAQVTDVQGVLIIQFFNKPPKISGNDDKLMFRSLHIASRGCTPNDAMQAYQMAQADALKASGGWTLSAALPEGWTTVEKFVWVSKH